MGLTYVTEIMHGTLVLNSKPRAFSVHLLDMWHWTGKRSRTLNKTSRSLQGRGRTDSEDSIKPFDGRIHRVWWKLCGQALVSTKGIFVSWLLKNEWDASGQKPGRKWWGIPGKGRTHKGTEPCAAGVESGVASVQVTVAEAERIRQGGLTGEAETSADVRAWEPLYGTSLNMLL